jgi:hypothetical protein
MDADPVTLRLYPSGTPTCDQCVIKTAFAVTGYVPGFARKKFKKEQAVNK